jgi:hypothetical protein
MKRTDHKKPPATTRPSDENAAPSPRSKRPALTKLSDVRREMGAIYWEARGKRLPVADATKLGYLLSLVAKIIETGDLEARLAEIERLLADQKGDKP